MISNTTYRLIASAVVAAFLVAGCQKEDTKLPGKDTDTVNPSLGVISFGITENGGWSSPATKASQAKPSRPEMHLMECDDPESPLGDVYIYIVEEDIEDVADCAPATRSGGDSGEGESGAGQSGTGDTSSDTTDVTQSSISYGVYAYQGKYTDEVPIPTTYDPSGEYVKPFGQIQNLCVGSNGAYTGGAIYAPGLGYWLQFIAYAPYMEEATEGGTDNPALISGENYPYLIYTADSNTAKTTDLLFGGRLGTNGAFNPICGDLNTPPDGETPPVQLSLSHILSKIKVNSSALAGTITSIKITDIVNSGTYNDGNKRVWSLNTSTQDYYFVSTKTDVTANPEYYLLPQNLSENAIIEIKVSVTTGGSELARSKTRDYTLRKQLKPLVETWQPNKQYTYNIATPREVQVEVTDEVVDVVYEGNTVPVKRNLEIKNCGLADAYVRVMISGAWVVDQTINGKVQSVVVAEWKNYGEDDDPDTKDDGTFVWKSTKPVYGGCNNEGWRCCKDGFFYYMNKTVPGEILPTLFESYMLTASPPVSGAYLELTILAQGVYAEDIPLIFPQEILDDVPTHLGPNPHK